MLRKNLLAAALVAASQPATGSAQEREWRSVPEYGLRIGFPRGAPIYDGLTWTHLHGWGMLLAGTEPVGRRLMIWADWNAPFYASPAEALHCPPASRVAGLRLNLSFPSRPSATCLEDRGDGTILVTVTAQAWSWPDRRRNPHPDLQSPLVNYSAFLHTTKRDLEADLTSLRQVLATVRINRPRA